MSGGSFNYAYGHVDRFAYELGDKLDRNDVANEWGHCYGMAPATVSKLREIEAQALRLAKLMREVEWLYSGDTGDDTFAERVAKIEAGKGYDQ